MIYSPSAERVDRDRTRVRIKLSHPGRKKLIYYVIACLASLSIGNQLYCLFDVTRCDSKFIEDRL